MFVRQSTYRREWMRRIDAEAQLQVLEMLYRNALDKIRVLEKSQRSQAFNAEEVRYLLKVAHPDKNGGAEIATTVTQKLLRMKR